MRVASRWRFRRRVAGILLNLCKANSGLHWNPTRRVARATRAVTRQVGRARAHVVHRLQQRDSVPARIIRTLLEEEGILESVTALVLRVVKVTITLVRKWPWAHTATAFAAYAAARRSPVGEVGEVPARIAGLLAAPLAKITHNFTVTAVAQEWI